MKTKSLLIKIATLTAVLAVGVSLFVNHNKTPQKVEAAQYLGDYDPYTYTGSYYDAIDFTAGGGMNGALRQAIANISVPKGFYTYSGNGETHLSTQLQYADEDPTNSGNMIYFYTRNSATKTNGTVDGTIMWNREHVWCQSLSNNNWGTSEAGTDILHLRPTYESTNKSRGNIPYGNTGHATIKTYSGMQFGWTGNGYFEPLDSVKGDVARIIMYLWTTYTGYKSYNDLNILSVFQSYDTLLSWHTSDKPDVLEGNRNDYSESSKQKNRNPFVDHPELAWKIFGDKVSSSVKNACMEAYPVDGGVTPPDPGNDTTKVTLNMADYATAHSLSSGNKVTSIALDSVVTASIACTDNFTGNVYIGTDYTEWRFYKSGSGTLNISVARGYDLVSAKGQIGTSNYGAPSEVVFSVINNQVSYNPGTNFNVKSLEVIYQESPGIYYTVTFNSNGGTSVPSQSVLENSTAHIPDDPEKDSDTNYNYTFDSWYLDAGFNNEYDFDTQVTEDITLYAKWIQSNRTAQEVVEDLQTTTSLAYHYTSEKSDVVDNFNNASFGISVSNYSSWSNKTATSSAIYAGNSAGGNNAIQLRKSTGSQAKSAIISTKSGGTLKKVTVSWEEHTTAGRKLNVYGKNTAYTSPDDLYNSSTYGTLLGTINYGSSTELVITGDYSYVGVVSNEGALYLESLSFEWQSLTSYTFSRAGIRFTGLLSVNLWNRLNSESVIQGFGLLLSDTDFLGDDELKDYYDLADSIFVKDFYRPVSQKAHPDTTNEGQDYIWSLFKNVALDKLTTVYVAVAYIKTTSGVIFLNQIEASVKSLATNMIAGPHFDEESYDGSLYHLCRVEE